MRRLALLPVATIAAFTVCVAGCHADHASGAATGDAGSDGGALTIDQRVNAWLSAMTLDEKIDQMHGLEVGTINDLYWTADNMRLGIPGFRMVDGPRGVRAGTATTFPVGMARGATWDPPLETQVGEAMGLECAAKGCNVLLAPTINVVRHPAWGRAQESYGEDPAHIGPMGAAFIQGVQQHVIASVKHFAVYSIENTRYDVNVTVDERTLREVYLPHFQKTVQVGHAGSVMTAYPSVNGHWCSENAHLLHDILDGEWAFDGFVESDWVLGTKSTTPAALAGLDIEMPAGILFGQPLQQAVMNGQVPESVIDEAVSRGLRKKLEFHLDAPPTVDPSVVESPRHTQLTLQVEHEGLVLLKNANATLPLDRATIGSVAVVGPLADTVNLGDTGSSNSVPTYAVTPLQGIQDRAMGVKVSHVVGPTLSAADQAAIMGAGAAIVVVGLTYEDEGEYEGVGMPGGDRHDMSLQIAADEEMLVQQVAMLNPRTIVVLEGGSAIVVRPWVDAVQSLVMAWYPGMEGGHAIADVLFGDVCPSGKLPITIPRAVTDLPPFDDMDNSVTYGFLHGYRYVDAMNETPEFPFGFGLSYTSFGYANLALGSATLSPSGVLTATFDVTNMGSVAGDEIAELYVAAQNSSVTRPPREVKAFQRVHLSPGQKTTVTLSVNAQDLAYWDVTKSAWVLEPIAYQVQVGSSSRDLPLSASFSVP
jgi:beta-glucosidase